MNKRELAKAVAVHSNVDLKTVTAVLDGFTDVVTAVAAKGEPVAMAGFAKFVKVERAARMGRNPATGEAIRIKASKRARITPMKAFKDAVLAPSQAPKLARGAWPTNDDAVRAAGKSPAVATKTATATVRATTRRAPVKKAATKRAPSTATSATRRPPRKAAAKAAPARKVASKRR